LDRFIIVVSQNSLYLLVRENSQILFRENSKKTHFIYYNMRQYFYIILAIAAFYTFTANNNNVANGNGWNSCSGCHGSSANTIVDSVALYHPTTGALMTGYYPDSTYIVRLVASNTSGTGSFPFFGFVMRALNGSSALTGTYTSIPTNTGVYGGGMLTHNNKLNPTGANYVVQATWRAPSGTGNGTISWQGIVNAVNNNNASSGDNFSATPKIVTYPLLGQITALNCAGGSTTGSLNATVAASGVSFTVPYTGGNGAAHTGQVVNSTGVTGLTATVSAASFANGAGTLVYTISGTATTSGTATFALNIGTKTCNYTVPVNLQPGSIISLNCAGGITTGTLNQGNPATGVSFSVPYTGGNGGTHSGQSVASTGSIGLNATLAPDTFKTGTGNLVYNVTGSPLTVGTASFALNIGGQTCTYNITVNAPLATVSTLNCGTGTMNGILYNGVTASGVSFGLPYTSGNGGVYNAQNVNSTGVTGLVANLSAGSVALGDGTISIPISGSPSGTGTASFAITFGGKSCTFNLNVIAPNGTIDSISCAKGRTIGGLTAYIVASGVSFKIPYYNGNGGFYSSQTVNSSGVTGLTATLNSDSFKTGSDSINYTVAGTPSASGNAIFAISIAGKTCNYIIQVALPNSTIDSLQCQKGKLKSPVTLGVSTSGNNFKIPYFGGNGGQFPTQIVNSSGITGIAATLNSDSLRTGNDSLKFDLSGIATTSGISNFVVNFNGKICVYSINVLIPLAGVDTLSCSTGTNTGILQLYSPVAGVTIKLPYKKGNGGTHNAISVQSTGVTGLTAKAPAGQLKLGDSSIDLTVTGVCDNYGVARFVITLGGKTCTYSILVKPHVGSIQVLDCNLSTTSSTLIVNVDAATKTVILPYVNGNGGSYQSQSINSTGVTGLTATLDSGILNNGNGSFVFALSGTPTSAGMANFTATIGGKTCSFSIEILNQPATATAVNCGSAVLSSPMISGANVLGSTLSVPYNGGNGGFYAARSINSSGITGVTASINATNIATGNGNLLFNLTGTPNSVGTLNFTIPIGTRTCLYSAQVGIPPGDVNLIDCGKGETIGSPPIQGEAASNLSISVPYTGGNGGDFPSSMVASSGVFGLTATRAAGTLTNAGGQLEYVVTGTPLSGGFARFNIIIGSKSCSYKIPIEAKVGISNSNKDVSVYYSKGYIHITNNKKEIQYSLFGIDGTQVISGALNPNQDVISVEDLLLPKGIYFFQYLIENKWDGIKIRID